MLFTPLKWPKKSCSYKTKVIGLVNIFQWKKMFSNRIKFERVMQFFVYANKSTPILTKKPKKWLARLKNAITFLLLVAKECPLNHEICVFHWISRKIFKFRKPPQNIFSSIYFVVIALKNPIFGRKMLFTLLKWQKKSCTYKQKL